MNESQENFPRLGQCVTERAVTGCARRLSRLSGVSYRVFQTTKSSKHSYLGCNCSGYQERVVPNIGLGCEGLINV